MKHLYVTYATWKLVVQANKFTVYHKDVDATSRHVYAGMRDYFVESFVDASTWSDYNAAFEANPAWTCASVPSPDEAMALIYGVGTIQSSLQKDNVLRVALQGREGDEFLAVSHNFCDRSTWYWQSMRETGVSLTNTGDNLTYSCPHVDLIDMYGGRVHDQEDARVRVDPTYQYSVKVYVNGVLKTERTRLVTSGGDYSVDHNAGTVTFFAALDPGAAVTADYSRCRVPADGGNASKWILRPDAGKVIAVEDAEVQFSSDFEFSDSVVLEFAGYVDVFAPQLLVANGGPYPAGTKIPLKSRYWHTYDQIIDEARGAYPVIAAGGGASFRGISTGRSGFPFRYGAIKELVASFGMEMRAYLQSGTVFGGDRVTATFYGTIRNE